MTDIVERLRQPLISSYPIALMREAADEIERLRKAESEIEPARRYIVLLQSRVIDAGTEIERLRERVEILEAELRVTKRLASDEVHRLHMEIHQLQAVKQ